MIKSRKEVRITYYITCPDCKDEIKGGSPSAVKFNLKEHQDGKNCIKVEVKK